MKTKRKILSLLNLMLFISSLLFGALSGFLSVPNLTAPSHFKFQYAEKHNLDNGKCSQLAYEENENENETESVSQVEIFLAAFHLSVFHIDAPVARHYSSLALLDKPNKPIYLSVCNFRI